MSPKNDQNTPKIALVGNPNVGKSVIFGFLTGHYAQVSNYPGTTVEVSSGPFDVKLEKVRAVRELPLLIDTPGINSLTPMSEEEVVTRNILLKDKIEAVVQVADSKNLKRALSISLQLAEMNLPFLLDLNMEDESQALGITIDKEKLSSLLGVPVIGTVAIQKKGLGEIKKKLISLKSSTSSLTYSSEIEKTIKEIENLLPFSPISKRSIALMILSSDKSLSDWLHQKLSSQLIENIENIRRNLARKFGQPLSFLIEKQRSRWVDNLINQVVEKKSQKKEGVFSWFGRISMHPLWGIFVLAGVLFALYEFVGNFGAQVCVDWFENTLFGDYINPWATKLFSKIFFFSPVLSDLFVGEYGIVTMALTYALAIVFPIVTTFFIFFSIMEDSGYLPRLAVMLNRIFRFMGLNGKAVVPMVLGLGCDTMATMSARIMETKKQKIILTLLLALGIPCSAQLGIVLAMLASLPLWATFVWLGVVIGVLLLVGFLASRILPGDNTPLLVEIPPIRKPTIINIASKTFARLEWYLKEVIPLFVLGTLILFLLDKLALLPKIQELANPLVVRLLDLPPSATEAFLIGFLRRDYGATFFFDLYNQGGLDVIQALVSLIVITLFVPCLANVLMIIKERGALIAAAIVIFIYPLAFLIGGIVNWALRLSA